MKDQNVNDMKCSGCGITMKINEVAINYDGSMMKNLCKNCANQTK